MWGYLIEPRRSALHLTRVNCFELEERQLISQFDCSNWYMAYLENLYEVDTGPSLRYNSRLWLSVLRWFQRRMLLSCHFKIPWIRVQMVVFGDVPVG